MFLNKNNILMNENRIIFLNRVAFDEYSELMHEIMDNMLNDLCEITGLEKQEILEDYILLNEYNPIDEIFKREGIYSEDKRKSLVLCMMGK